MLKKINKKCYQFLNIVFKEREARKAKKAKKIEETKKTEKIISELYDLPKFTVLSIVKNPIEKAKDLKKGQDELKLCKTMNICPKCGKSLSTFVWSNNDEFHLEDYTIRYCKDCQKRFEQDINFYY